MEESSLTDLEQRMPRRRRLLKCILVFVGLLLVVAFVLRLLFVRWIEFTDQSMYPSVTQFSRILALRSGTCKVGDLVWFHQDGMKLVRRVVAGPGSTVQQTVDGLVVDGVLLERRPVDVHTYYLRHLSGGSSMALTCGQVVERIGEKNVRLCVDGQSERDLDPIRLSDEEIYVRCDNRAFCSRRQESEGRLRLTEVQAIGYWLMSTRDDSDQPFYKRWFGRFERLP
ncbi:MAG: hypothetical protein JW797_10460 [Bradymonadales bacterium]|nr:hypothetical protein [Bradymonadales bacterium]